MTAAKTAAHAMATGPTPQTDTDETAAAERRRRTGALRRRLAMQLFFEFVLPLGSYYVLRAAGAGQWFAMVAGGVLVLPWIVWGLLRRGRVDTMVVFTLSPVVIGTLLSLVTGDPRVLMIRDSWLTAAVGLWMLSTLLTRRPFMLAASRGIAIAKAGEAGAAEWEGRWDTAAMSRHHMRLVTTIWGTGLLLDAVLRVVLVYTIPLDAFPLTSTLLLLGLIV